MLSYVSALFIWSAAHLLWQGVVLAAAFTWWSRSAERSPAVRHQIAVGVVLVMLLALIVNAVVAHLALLANARLGGDGALVAEPAWPMDVAVRAFDRSFVVVPALATVWGIGVALGAARLVLGAFALRRLLLAAAPASPELLERIALLARAAGLAHVPPVITTPDAVVPFVTGIMRPILVLPMDSVAGEERDALIHHELAHIQRADTRSNAFLRFSQVVFWFHPGSWHLVTQATAAREEASDLLAASRVGNGRVLARALVALETRRQRNAGSLAANDGALTTRIRRLIESPGEKRWHDSAVLPVAAMLCVFTVGAASSARFASASDSLAVVSAAARAVPSQLVHVAATDPAGRFTLTLLNGRVSRATIAGVTIDRSAIRRTARDVALIDEQGAAVLTLQLDPRGAIRWMPREQAR